MRDRLQSSSLSMLAFTSDWVSLKSIFLLSCLGANLLFFGIKPFVIIKQTT